MTTKPNFFSNLFVVCYHRHDVGATGGNHSPFPQELVDFHYSSRPWAVLLRAPDAEAAMALVNAIDGHLNVNYTAVKAIPVTTEMVKTQAFVMYLTGSARMFQENPPNIHHLRALLET